MGQRGRARGGSSLALILMVLGAAILWIANTGAPAAMADGAGLPFTCAAPTDFLTDGAVGGATTQLSAAPETASPVFTALGAPASVLYNAVGLDPVNGFIYGVEEGSDPTDLVQIDSAGNVTPLGDVSGLTMSTSTSGAFDPTGKLWVGDGIDSDLWAIDVTATPPTATELATSTAFLPLDMTYSQGFMWGLYNGEIYRVNLATGAVDTFAVPSPIAPNLVTNAAWTYENGDVAFLNTISGVGARVSVTDPSSASPTFTYVSGETQPADATASAGDATSCAGEQADLGIVTTAPSSVAFGSTITWTLAVTNAGPGDSSGFTVTDPIPAGFTNVKSSTPGCTVTGNTLTCTEGALAAGAGSTVTLTGTASGTGGTCATDTATVTGDDPDDGAANDSSGAQTCIAAAAQSITFTSTPPPDPQVGESYTVSATSSSGLPVTFTVAPASAGVCSVSGSVVTLLEAGTCTIEAAQAGSADYQPVTIPQSLTVAPAPTGPTGSTSPPVAGVPASTGPPAISGTPKAGSVLSCSTGTWTDGPTTYTYQWYRDGTPLQGATGTTYTVVTLDEGSTLTCAVTASDASGAGTPATSAGLPVPVPFVAHCPAATGRLAGQTLGLIHLGVTPAQARHAYRHSSDRGKRYQLFFCLTPIGVRVGLSSPALLRTLTPRQRRHFAKRVVWISTSNPFYALDGIRPGALLTAAQKVLHTYKALPIGRNIWYLAPLGKVTAVMKVRHGVVQEIGIAVASLNRTLAQRRVFMRSFG